MVGLSFSKLTVIPAVVVAATAVSVDAVKAGGGYQEARPAARRGFLPFRPTSALVGGLGIGAMINGASATAAKAPSMDELKVKHAARIDELSELLNDESKMKKRFVDFYSRKYGVALDGCAATSASDYATDTVVSASCSDSISSLANEKYLAFSYNVALAHERNLKSGGKTVHGITRLMDLTREQFKRLLGYKPDDAHLAEMKAMYDAREETRIGKSGAFVGDEAKPMDTVDWREKGAVTAVKDQGQCGSCWAFSTVESMESAALVQGIFSDPGDFIGSPQELVSCDTHGNDQGCNGGLPLNGFAWFSRHSLEPESDYPYTSGTTKKTGVCKKDESEGVLEVDGKPSQVSIWGIGETDDMKDYIMNSGPLSVAVHANDAWQTYEGGVVSYDDCPDNQQPNHAVQAVALNTDDDTPYWTIRNSWNTDWGEDGYIRISYGQNTCNVAFEGVGVNVKKVDDRSSTNPKISAVVEESGRVAV